MPYTGGSKYVVHALLCVGRIGMLVLVYTLQIEVCMHHYMVHVCAEGLEDGLADIDYRRTLPR
jgi:hypothetical protein